MSAVGGGHQPAGSRPGLVLLGWLAAAGIGSSILIMIMTSAARYSASVPLIPRPPGPLPVELHLRLPEALVTLGLWAAAVAAGVGVVAGLVAVSRGARYPAWLLIGAALVAIAALTVLPPAGSTDTVSYATYGRMALLGHNPYVMTPDQLKHTGDPIGQLAPLIWHRHPSLYGPLATAEQWAAAKLGGTSAVRIAAWLKLGNAVAFTGVMLGLDRLLRADPARRARAHLLWSVNPLMLWGLVAGGHLDVLAAGAALLGLTALRAHGPTAGPAVRPAAALAAGMLIGVAADFMLTYLLLGLALAWALRRSAVGLAAALAGICATLLPAYALIGTAIFHSLAKRQGKVSADTFYQLISAAYRHTLPHSVSLAIGLAFVALAILLLRRLPDAVPGLPAIMPALAISIAWLFIWYYQLPWYDTMAVGVLAIYPASRLDWVVTGQLTAGTVAMMPGSTAALHPHWLARLAYLVTFRLMPAVLFLAVVALVWLCLSRGWKIAQRPAAAPPDVPALERAAAPDRLSPGWPGRRHDRAGKTWPAATIRVLCCQSSLIGQEPADLA
jgi:alpha-1,6-mannosyltransferase